MRYFKLRATENIRLPKKKFTPTTKKKLHSKNDATPKPLYIKKWEMNAPKVPIRLATFASVPSNKLEPSLKTLSWSSFHVNK